MYVGQTRWRPAQSAQFQDLWSMMIMRELFVLINQLVLLCTYFLYRFLKPIQLSYSLLFLIAKLFFQSSCLPVCPEILGWKVIFSASIKVRSLILFLRILHSNEQLVNHLLGALVGHWSVYKNHTWSFVIFHYLSFFFSL